MSILPCLYAYPSLSMNFWLQNVRHDSYYLCGATIDIDVIYQRIVCIVWNMISAKDAGPKGCVKASGVAGPKGCLLASMKWVEVRDSYHEIVRERSIISPNGQVLVLGLGNLLT